MAHDTRIRYTIQIVSIDTSRYIFLERRSVVEHGATIKEYLHLPNAGWQRDDAQCLKPVGDEPISERITGANQLELDEAVLGSLAMAILNR